jgi:TIR domain
MTAPHAFLSYTRLDDEFHGGAITGLRRLLELGVRVVTGDRSFTIFQDVEGIEFGQHWPSRLDEALASARFLIPVLSPSFFRSEPCRDELAKFLELERRAGRRDLILPLYLVTAPVLDRSELRATDPLAQALHERQWRDWRAYAYLPIEHADHRRAIFELAAAIAAAMERAELAPTPLPPDPAQRLEPKPVSSSIRSEPTPAPGAVETRQFHQAAEQGDADLGAVLDASHLGPSSPSPAAKTSPVKRVVGDGDEPIIPAS